MLSQKEEIIIETADSGWNPSTSERTCNLEQVTQLFWASTSSYNGKHIKWESLKASHRRWCKKNFPECLLWGRGEWRKDSCWVAAFPLSILSSILLSCIVLSFSSFCWICIPSILRLCQNVFWMWDSCSYLWKWKVQCKMDWIDRARKPQSSGYSHSHFPLSHCFL